MPEVRNFYTDGSGTKATDSLLTTAWAWAETTWDPLNIRTQRLLHTHGAKSPHFNSVQWCEARAILKAVQLAEPGEAIHIHTDSKGTVQQLRAMLGKQYREQRNIQSQYEL